MGSGPTSEGGPRDALVFVTVYNRLSWGQKILSRTSQHVLLSSQTLGDLFESIPCTSNEIPEEITDESGSLTRYRQPQGEDDMAVDSSAGAAICIEGIVYGDGETEDDYAECASSAPLCCCRPVC